MDAPGPLIAIVGETASGKSSLALRIAELFNGEIICADSRTVYKGMDIGTAKPSKAERRRIAHHLLDVVAPGEPFTVADFKRLALAAIVDISSRGKVPIIAGGSGLYVDSILFDYTFNQPSDPLVRATLNQLTIEELQYRLVRANIPLPENARNARHLIRTFETGGHAAVPKAIRRNTLVIGLRVPIITLKSRVAERVERMVAAGLLPEVTGLFAAYGEVEALRTPGYKAFLGYDKGLLSLDEAKAQFIKNDLLLAKRQRTWFKRNKSIRWIDSPDEALRLTAKFLNKIVRS